jgi:glucose-6-phosphate 1-dehydrogenase
LTNAETVGVEGRGGYYETAGVVRDMIQNHVFQVLSLVAMEPPVSLESEAVRDEKFKAMRAAREFTPARVRAECVRGQYGPGSIAGKPVPGYRREPDVAPDSTTETLAALKMYFDNRRWAGVPFYIRSGKRLPKRVTEIALHFNALPHPLFFAAPGANSRPNTLILRIQPDEGIALRFASKIPGQTIAIREVAMDFRYGTAFGTEAPEAYERLLLDVMRGDATLFTRHDEVEAQWAYVDPIQRAWRERALPLLTYSAGTWGPAEAQELVARQGHSWNNP